MGSSAHVAKKENNGWIRVVGIEGEFLKCIFLKSKLPQPSSHVPNNSRSIS